jgi:hypothetical protein
MTDNRTLADLLEKKRTGEPIVMVTASSIYEASERDYRLVAASDGIAGIYDRGERELAEIGVTRGGFT